MKVLIVNSVCGTGSTGRICTDLYDVLQSEGHECVIAHGRGESSSGYKCYKIGGKIDNLSHLVDTRIFDRHGYSSKKATKKFIEFIEHFSPDIIHIHNIHGYYLNIPVFFNYLKNIFSGKIIWTMHDCWAFSPHSAYIDYDKEGNLPVNETRASLKNYPKAIIFNRSTKNYLDKEYYFSGIPNLTIVSPSTWLKKMLWQSFFSQYETVVINNGIDRTSFYKEKVTSDLLNKKLILGVANIWEDRKGLIYFNELSEKISNDFQIILVGKTKGKINKKIMHVEQTANIDEMREYYNRAFCFVNPTLEDNYPTTNLESLCCGTPIIAFNTGGNNEVVQGNFGIITESKTSNAILDSLRIMEKNYSNYQFLLSENDFSKKQMYLEYLELYKRR